MQPEGLCREPLHLSTDSTRWIQEVPKLDLHEVGTPSVPFILVVSAPVRLWLRSPIGQSLDVISTASGVASSPTQNQGNNYIVEIHSRWFPSFWTLFGCHLDWGVNRIYCHWGRCYWTVNEQLFRGRGLGTALKRGQARRTRRCRGAVSWYSQVQHYSEDFTKDFEDSLM